MCSGPFSSIAVKLGELGLAPLPCGGNDGKVPLVTGFTKWQSPPATETIARWVVKFGESNIGVACRASRLAVVDIDDPTLLLEMLSIFGDTPLIIQTPSGGYHLWYRAQADLRNANLRTYGYAVDIKAAGGQVLVPPSSRVGKGAYTFKLGSWTSVNQLPNFAASALAQLRSGRQSTPQHQKVPIGNRNDALFQHLCYMSPWKSHADVLAEAFEFNRYQVVVPESDDKISATALSVWNYQRTDRLHKPAGVSISAAEIERLQAAGGKDYSDAVALLVELKRQHGGRARRGSTFAIAPQAMIDSNVIPGIRDRRRIERARDVLLTSRLIICARAANHSFHHQTAQYSFGSVGWNPP